MAKSVSLIGVAPEELPWLRMLLFLLRHPDPLVGEMARRTLLYLSANTPSGSARAGESLDHAG